MFIKNFTLSNGLNVCLDYISFTMLNTKDPLEVLSFLGLESCDFNTPGVGQYGYRAMLRHCSYPISVLYDGNDDMGVHVNVTGSGVAFFMESYMTAHGCTNLNVYEDLCYHVLEDGNFSRLDLAVDDMDAQYYSLPELSYKFNNDLYTSRFRTFREVKTMSKQGIKGHSINLGSRTSNVYLRIYDKKLEQKLPAEHPEWIRWELELKKERANAVAAMLVAGQTIPSITMGLIKNYVRLIIKDNNRDSRCSSDVKWDIFLNGVDKATLYQASPEKDLDSVKEWLMHQCAPSFAAVYQADQSLDFFYSMITEGDARMKLHLINLVNSVQEDLAVS